MEAIFVQPWTAAYTPYRPSFPFVNPASDQRQPTNTAEVKAMDCPICGNEVEKGSSKIESQSGAFKNAYKCSSCGKVFKKPTLLRRGLRFLGSAALVILTADMSDSGGGNSST